MDDLLERDRRHVWHPYGAMPSPSPPLPVTSAQGVRLRLSDGRELIDGMSSWWCAIHGYGNPVLDQAVREQLEQLAPRLVELTPRGLDRVFFADSGSVSVEVAIKMALQYWQAHGRPERRRLMTVRGGYHGDTFGAMAVCDPVSGMHSLFTGVLPSHLFAERPPAGFGAPLDEDYATHLSDTVEQHSRELAAVILEPVVQGAGGMHFYSPEVVRLLRRLCDEHGLLLILDEIATGFGRTGAMFAAEHAEVTPDIMCVGKALTGGYVTLAATLCTAAVADAISGGPGGALMHGPTYMANPLACAAALASLALLEDGGWRQRIEDIEVQLSRGLAPAGELPGVGDVRVLGAIGVVQLSGPVDVPAATRAALGHSVWLRPFRDLVYVMPPYVCNEEEVGQIAAAVVAAARAGAVP
jgi:adenosylmethionine-8-amino-7-oxononanoate aminotransferase